MSGETFPEEGTRFLATVDDGTLGSEVVEVTVHYSSVQFFGQVPAFYEGEINEERLVNPDRILGLEVLT